MPPDRHLHPQRPKGSVVGWAERAVGWLQSRGKSGLLRERDARPPQVLERSILSLRLGPGAAGRGCLRMASPCPFARHRSRNPGKYELQAITWVMALRSYSSPDR